jgi:hypothetical protein
MVKWNSQRECRDCRNPGCAHGKELSTIRLAL